jgi:general secretion pathway protein L
MNIYGIDIGEAAIKIAQVERKLRGYSVKRLKAVQGGGDPSASLKDALSQMGFDPREDAVAAVFTKDRVSTRVFTMAIGDEKKIAEAMPFELESLVPFDAENMVIAHQLARTEKGETQVSVAFTPKAEFDRFLSIFAGAGADPDYVIPAQFAMTAAVEGANQADALTVDLGAGAVMIVATRAGAPILSHTVDMGLQSNMGDSATAGRDGEAGGRLSSFPEKLAREIRLVMTALSRGSETFRPLKISLCGGVAGDVKLQETLAERIGVPVERASAEGDGAPCDLDGLRDRWGKPPIFAPALGAALIAVKDNETRANFRAGANKKSGGIAGARREAVLTLALVAVFVFAWLGAYIAEGIRLDGKYATLKNELRAEFKKAMPEVTNVVSEITQLKSALASLDSKSAALKPALTEKDPFLDRFTGVTEALPEGAKLDITELTYEWDRILLSGRTDSFEKVEQFRKNLEKLEWVGKSVVEGAKTGLAGGGVEFKITVGVAR